MPRNTPLEQRRHPPWNGQLTWFSGGLLAVAQAPPDNLSMFDPVSPPAESILNLTYLLLGITGAIFLVVEGMLVWCIYRYRQKPGTETEPPQNYGSKPVELAWTVTPALIVFVLFLIVFRTIADTRRDPHQAPPPGSKPLHVTVIGHQWWWEYVYEKYDGTEIRSEDVKDGKPVSQRYMKTANELHVPASADGTPRPVYLHLQSVDVIHSFWVPRLAGKTDVIPNRINHMWFQSAIPGLYLGQCAEYCGTQHAGMLLRVYVDPVDEFETWLANERKPAVEDPAAAAGKKVLESEACMNCHTVRGTAAQGGFGPDLTHLMSRETIASGLEPNNKEMLRVWVKDPQQIKPGCRMPAMNLTDAEIDQVVAYLLTLK
ncbi:MAG: cytochrome c oxidase subunit II [Gemmataceae bacterium]